MSEKTRTVVRIAGREYPITSYDGEEYVRRVGAYVDRKIGELALATRLSPLEVATLAAVSPNRRRRSRGSSARSRRREAKSRALPPKRVKTHER